MVGHASSLPGPLDLGAERDKKSIFDEDGTVNRWTDNFAVKTVWRRFDLRDNCPSFTCCIGVDGDGVSTASIKTV